MNVRRSVWKWVCATLCLNASVCLAQADLKPATPPQPSGGAIQFNVLVDPPSAQVGTIEILTDEQPPSATRALGQLLRIQTSGIGTLGANAEGTAETGKYWIGLICATPTDALRAHLELEANKGLVVEEVSEEGPARKAGVQRFDVLLSAAGPAKTDAGSATLQELSSVADLIQIVQAAGASPLKLELIRKGKKESVEVTPAERPKPVVSAEGERVTAVISGHGDPSTGGPVTLGLRLAGPMIVNHLAPLPEGMTVEFQPAEGQPERVIVKQKEQTWESDLKSLEKLPPEISMIVRRQLEARSIAAMRTNVAYRTGMAPASTLVVHGVAAALPDDVAVTVVRKGASPARITIKKSDQAWEATEDDLSKLPKEIRLIAESALMGHAVRGRALFTTAVPVPPTLPVPAMPPTSVPPQVSRVRVIQPPVVPAIKPAVPTSTDLERKLQDLTEQVDKLRQAVEKIQPKQ